MPTTKIKKKKVKAEQLDAATPANPVVKQENLAEVLKEALFQQVSLDRPLEVEKLLGELRAYKIGTAIAGAFSPAKCLFGACFNSIPRGKRAAEAGKLQELFAAARCYHHGSATEKQKAMVNDFHKFVQECAEKRVNTISAYFKEPKPRGINPYTLNDLERQLKHNKEVVTSLTVEVMVKQLTLANMLKPKGFNERNITRPSKRFEIESMVDGAFQAGYIENLREYVAEFFAEVPEEQFFLDVKGDTRLEIQINQFIDQYIKASKEAVTAQSLLNQYHSDETPQSIAPAMHP